MSLSDQNGKVKEEAVRSAKWALVARVSQVLGQAAMTLLLPFWLAPEDFGIITMFTSVLALVIILQQAGLMEATVQRDRDAESVRDTAFWLSAIIGLLLYIAVHLLAPVISQFFGEPRLTLPLRIASLQVILLGFSNILLAWMMRTFRYRPYALAQLISSLVMIAAAALFAVRGLGYWAYIAGILGGALVRLLLAWRWSDWRPRLRLQVQWLPTLVKFGGFVTLEMVLGWFLVWFDNVIVARALGSEAAGIYALAFNIANMTVSIPCSAVTGITLSTFSRMQQDAAALRSAYLKGSSLIAAYAIPAGIGLALLGPAFAGALYPGRWDGLGAILPVLALYAGFGHLWILNTDAFKAIGKPQTMLKIYLPVVAVMLPVYLWSVHFGLLPFTIARSLIVLIGAVPHTWYAVRSLGLPERYLWDVVRPPLFASAVMAALVWGASAILGGLVIPSTPVHLALLLSIVVGGGLVYWLVLRALAPDFSSQAVDLLQRSLGWRDGHG
ncbi:MAG: lipopolysaccharide biosynthesis protein [Anaerolineae bacterium]|nr:lipopolysaccharide biosynthesis protein [Anaerolineae bacterium]